MPKKTSVWKTAVLSPDEILLDLQNPRIEVDAEASQDEVRQKLLDYEDVLDLAREIDRNKGLFYGERIITIIEDGNHVVLEGNRRVAACQMLVNPTLVPATYRLRFPRASAETLEALSRIAADVAPDRRTAEPILTKRHTEQGVKPWSPVAKMRRAVRLLDKHSVPEVAAVLGTTPSQVKRLIRPYRLLKYAIDMKGWTAEERKALEDEKLTTNPYTRFFTLRQTKDSLRLTFDEDENVVSDLPPKVFKDQMKRIVRDFLIPDPQTHRPRCDTRTDPGNYFAEFNAAYAAPRGRAPAKTAQATHAAAPINTSATGSVRPKAPRASVFFENLECHVQDDKLIKLTLEISKINHTRMTIAASLLTRAIFECALVYKLKKEKKWQGLINAEGKDPGLNEIVKFCGNFKNGVFAEQNICRTLQSHTTHQAKNYLDAITHMKYQEADSLTLESVANNLRQVIQHILMGN